MKALQTAYQATFILGFLGFVSSEILDLVCMYQPSRGARLANQLIQRSLQAVLPHFVFARWGAAGAPEAVSAAPVTLASSPVVQGCFVACVQHAAAAVWRVCMILPFPSMPYHQSLL